MMGWASGSELAENIWDEVRNFIPENKRERVAKKIWAFFEDFDCDTLEECVNLYKDTGYFFKNIDDE